MAHWITITGSSNGIGRELAKIFAREGYSVVLHGRNKADLESSYKQVASYGGAAEIVEGDLLEERTLVDLISLSKDKDICLLVNNVGYRCPGIPLGGLSLNQINEMISLSLSIPIRLSKEIYQHYLKKGSGTIMNMNSIVGLEPKENRSVYTAVRYGLRGFTESLRLEAKKNNIRIMAIYPTRVMTKPEFSYGWKVSDACEKIYSAYLEGINNLILDDRPSKYRPASYPLEAKVHLLNA